MAGYEEFCFIRDVEKYQRGVFPNPHDLMARARQELLQCDALLIDISDNPTGGRIIEAGMAFGSHKPVIVIAKHGVRMGVPMTGIASTFITYNEIADIVEPLKKFRQQ